MTSQIVVAPSGTTMDLKIKFEPHCKPSDDSLSETKVCMNHVQPFEINGGNFKVLLN